MGSCVRALIDFFMMFRSKKKLVEKIMELGLCHDRSKLGRVSNLSSFTYTVKR